MMVFGYAETKSDLLQIIELQSANTADRLSGEEITSQGFVTVRHDLETLEAMNSEFKHAVAKNENKVVGYALVMTKRFAKSIPILMPMFEKINLLVIEKPSLIPPRYVVMGQICIAKDFRGKGVFASLYETLRNQLVGSFDCMVTEVAARNTRSVAAHSKVGFRTVMEYDSELGERWNIVVWNWK